MGKVLPKQQCSPKTSRQPSTLRRSDASYVAGYQRGVEETCSCSPATAAAPLPEKVRCSPRAGGLEVDAIVETRAGAWAAFETEHVGPPATLGVITATGFAYQRPDGVAVIPIGALGP